MRERSARLFELGKAVGGAVLKRVGRAASRLQEESPLSVDVLESADEYLVVFDAPGATASDVDVRYRGSEVLVRVDRFREFREGFEMRFPGRGLALDGSARLPDDAVVDPERARARLNDDGTLYVFLPKVEGVEVEGGETEMVAEDDETEAETDGDEVTEADDATGAAPGADE
jgi:HSP20 family molecular chaperone IbpA